MKNIFVKLKKIKTLLSFPNFKNLYSCILKIHTLISLTCVGVQNKYSLKPYCWRGFAFCFLIYYAIGKNKLEVTLRSQQFVYMNASLLNTATYMTLILAILRIFLMKHNSCLLIIKKFMLK